MHHGLRGFSLDAKKLYLGSLTEGKAGFAGPASKFYKSPLLLVFKDFARRHARATRAVLRYTCKKLQERGRDETLPGQTLKVLSDWQV
jgi:hypothetical protein